MINAIVAFTKDRGIGFNNSIPWSAPEDLKRFQQLTTGGVVIMGRKTWDSLPIKPLKGRKNVVISHKPIVISSTDENGSACFSFQREYNVATLEKPLIVAYYDDAYSALVQEKYKASDKDVWIIGGQSLYEQLLPNIDRLYVTQINGNFMCDRFFPYFEDKFKLLQIEGKDKDGNIFKIYGKR